MQCAKYKSNAYKSEEQQRVDTHECINALQFLQAFVLKPWSSRGGNPMHIQTLEESGSEVNYRSISSYCDCRRKKPRDVIYTVDADNLVRETLFDLSGLIDIEITYFDSPQDFLRHSREDESSCLILNLCSHDQKNFGLQCQLAAEASPPVIFICSHGDVSSAVRALKSGAVELLTTPIKSIDLAEAVLTAFALDRRLRRQRIEQEQLQQRHSLLTPREREVLPLVVRGLMNKQAAGVLGISETTLQIHRSQVMRKMQADSVAELVRMAVTLQIPIWRDGDPDGRESSDLQFLTVLRKQWQSTHGLRHHRSVRVPE
jgi:FixJ family two-component response regulator